MASSTQYEPPESILVVGSGVFGLSTILALLSSPVYAKTAFTLLTPPFLTTPASSHDHSRIIRSDYSSPSYAALAARAQHQWRSSHWGAEDRYHEAGLLLTSSDVQNPYVSSSLHNNRVLAAAANELDSIIELPNPSDILRESKTGESNSTSTGLWGYLNTRAGWADASAALMYAYDLVVASNRVDIITGTATKLVTSPSSPTIITGVTTDSGTTLTAALTILATGAHTSSLLDLRGRVTATAQPLLYIQLSEAEYDRLKGMPTLLNMSNGLFIIPPHGPTRTLKIAQHSYGYRNPTTIPAPFSTFSSSSSPSSSSPSLTNPPKTITTSLPTAPNTPLPLAAQETLLAYLAATLPSLANHPVASTRLCHYADTATADFLICYPPATQGLFVATGGSGHGFKFLPVLGEKIVEVMEGREAEGFRDLWRWRDGVDGDDVVCEDGSRGGVRGLVIETVHGLPS